MKRTSLLLGAAALALLGWWLSPRAFFACYLAAWWFCMGALLGGLANVWLHNLTGGAWGEAIRAPMLTRGRLIPLLCLLFLPLLAGLDLLYPWAAGTVDWHAEFSAPAFKAWWLSRPFFIARALFWLALWSALSSLTRKPSLQRSPAMAAFGLLAYVFSLGLASVDWIMSLQPAWSSSVFGWLAMSGQMLTGMALAVALLDREAARAQLPDLGNLLMMYVLSWAYLTYVQFLIIWAENLPHEIVWYVHRSTPLWVGVAWMLVVFHLAAPLMLLLSRRAKRAPPLMGMLAWNLLAAHLLDCWWLVLPSVQALATSALWLAPMLAAVFVLLWRALASQSREEQYA
ncbi:MAG: hypothetical protein V4724_38195 [Pseudomonadota bacterium]